MVKKRQRASAYGFKITALGKMANILFTYLQHFELWWQSGIIHLFSILKRAGKTNEKVFGTHIIFWDHLPA